MVFLKYSNIIYVKSSFFQILFIEKMFPDRLILRFNRLVFDENYQINIIWILLQRYKTTINPDSQRSINCFTQVTCERYELFYSIRVELEVKGRTK